MVKLVIPVVKLSSLKNTTEGFTDDQTDLRHTDYKLPQKNMCVWVVCLAKILQKPAKFKGDYIVYKASAFPTILSQQLDTCGFANIQVTSTLKQTDATEETTEKALVP